MTSADTPFVRAAIDLMQQNLELVQDSDKELEKAVTYPLQVCYVSTGTANSDACAATVVGACKCSEAISVYACCPACTSLVLLRAVPCTCG